ncbi:hypothetical protein [Arthrobacter sp. NPDC057013]
MSSPPVTHSHNLGRSDVWAQVIRLPLPADPASSVCPSWGSATSP